MEQNFETLKSKILSRAKKADACADQYKRAYKAATTAELLQVVKDNFSWAACHKVIDVAIIEQYQAEFNANEIWANTNVKSGYLIAANDATVFANGNATVYAAGNTTVYAYNKATVYANCAVVYASNSTVHAYGNTTVYAYDSSVVEAYDDAYIMSYSPMECKLFDNAIHRIQGTNTIRYASDGMKFENLKQE